MIESPLARLTDEQIEELGKEFDAIHDEVFADLGDRDRRYIASMIEMHRRLARARRACCCSASRYQPAWVAGTATLSLAKILENMEIGHNVMHGQWDWMNDPQINSSTWDWDTASTAEAWKHSHNYVHHTYTNIRGKDKDLGYEIMRIDPHQKWHPVYLLQPFYNLLLVAFFEWGVAFHDLDFEAIRTGEKSKEQLSARAQGHGRARRAARSSRTTSPARSSARCAAAAVRAGLQAARRPSRRERVARRLRRRPRSSRTVARAADGRPSARRCRRTSRRTSSATSGPTRSSSAATSPTRRTPSARRRSRTRRAAASTCASCSARPTSRAARCSTSSAATSATRSSTTSTRTCRARATREIAPRVQGDLRALRAALQHRPVPQAARHACSARSCGSPSPAASRGRSPARTAATAPPLSTRRTPPAPHPLSAATPASSWTAA